MYREPLVCFLLNGGGGCALCLRVVVDMLWFCILYSIFKVFDAACVKHMFGLWL